MKIHSIVSSGTHDNHPNWEAMTVLRTKQGYRFQTGYVERGESATHISGERRPGPWAYTFGLSVCITADPEQSSGADSRRRLKDGREIEVEDGDILLIDDEAYEVETYRRGEYIDLHRVYLNATRVKE